MTTGQEKFTALIKKAQKTNQSRSKIDRKTGFAPPEDCPIDNHVHTVLNAIEAGIVLEDWNTIAEAYDMLKTALGRIRAE